MEKGIRNEKTSGRKRKASTHSSGSEYEPEPKKTSAAARRRIRKISDSSGSEFEPEIIHKTRTKQKKLPLDSSSSKRKPEPKKTKAKAIEVITETKPKLTRAKRNTATLAKTACNETKEIAAENVSISSEIQHEVDIPALWDVAAVLAHQQKVPHKLAQNFVALLEEGCTLPFIARYRKAAVDHYMPDKLQDLFECYQNVSQLKKKVKTVLETLKKNKKLSPEIGKSILNARNLSELDLVYAPLKSHALSLAERARNLGLEPIAVRGLNGEFIDLQMICNDEEELSSPDKVDGHITHIIADIIYKDTRVLEQMRSIKEETRFSIQSSRTKSSTKEKEDNGKKLDSKSDPETYKLYFEWKCPSHYIKPHQTLALNRGEDEKILSVKVVIPDWFYNKLERFCSSLWKSQYWVKKGLTDAYNRLIKPWLSRQVRADLTAQAQKEAVKTFTTNLEKYLLTEPVKNRTIAGLDPGFKAGCKVGIINSNGDKLEACTIYPNLRNINQNDFAAKQLKDLLTKHKVELIGLGNGTACRETELWLKSHNISQNIPIVIVPEQGASIYSISKEAQKEHPNMDPNLISALSIARRVLDPLGELIKVDPKNLGVGLYQHDIPPKMMESALDCAVEKVVSLVGVDINTASQAMLRRISGLNDGRAKKILTYRQDNGGFKSRAEILKVGGIGKVTYQQCAGFLKVVGGSEPLDATIIHPESYSIAKKFAKKITINIKELSQPHFPGLVETKTASIDIERTSQELGTDVCTLELIINAFKQKSYEDNVITFCRPVYSLAVQAKDQIQDGMTLTGVVRNVVPFGCFVDCGVGENGLIHRSNLGPNQTPKLGDRVSVTVIPSMKANKMQLKLEKILD